MDIEFHYYITYILARKAGFNKEEAGIIAYACQHTDDNTLNYCINFEVDNPFFSTVSQTMDITKPNEKRESIYPIFHFFPGDPEEPKVARKHPENNKWNTIPDSKNACKMFDDAINSKNLFRIGIAAHVYADTWAHQNFCGTKVNFNQIDNLIGSILPNIGHADAAHNPDMVCHKWVDKRLSDNDKEIVNNDRFIEAANRIFYKFLQSKNPQLNNVDQDSLWEETKELLLKAMNKRSVLGSLFNLSQKKRIKAYRNIFPEISDYNKDGWRHDAVDKNENEMDYFDKYWGKADFKKSNWYQFQEAIKQHHDVSMNILKHLYHQ
jgi:hypothetical protein